jgi:hypothetical protein
VLRGLGNGECIFRDLDGRAGRIGIDLISDELRQRLDTNPTRARPEVPVPPRASPAPFTAAAPDSRPSASPYVASQFPGSPPASPPVLSHAAASPPGSPSPALPPLPAGSPPSAG